MSTSLAQLLKGKPGKIRPGIISNEPHDTLNEFEEEFHAEIASISGKAIWMHLHNLFYDVVLYNEKYEILISIFDVFILFL